MKKILVFSKDFGELTSDTVNALTSFLGPDYFILQSTEWGTGEILKIFEV